MILTLHLLVGAVIATRVDMVPLAFLLAFLSHYLLDFIPHQEYEITGVMERNWGGSLFAFLKVGLDIAAGTALILLFSRDPVVFMGAFFAILPDGLTLLHLTLPYRILKIHFAFHQKLHYFKEKSPAILGIFNQLVVGIFAILLLL